MAETTNSSDEGIEAGSVAAAEIDYLSKDFASFRRLMLDRIARVAPDAVTGHPADLGTVITELLAHAADHASHYQDAVATEAYLGTARLRTSVRRHARLLDYPMHDGCNARTWVAIAVGPGADGRVLPAGTALLTRIDGQPAVLTPADVVEARSRGAQVFETMHDLLLRSAHDQMQLQAGVALPVGTCTATLLDGAGVLALRAADVLIFEELTSESGAPSPPQRRHAVRLTAVETGQVTADGQGAVRVTWSAADALPLVLVPERTRVVGNVVLADHGYSLPAAEELWVEKTRPELLSGPLTWQTRVIVSGRAVPLDPAAAAVEAMPPELGPGTLVQPAIALRDDSGKPWEPRRDLLGSSPHAPDFVVETEDDGRTYLRFGDDTFGKRAQGRLWARYRVGNGRIGNIGAEALYHIVSDLPGLLRARNPLPARGGSDAEPLEQVRVRAPHFFRRQERAVTGDDYAALSRSYPEVIDAAVRRRWNGTWVTHEISVLRAGGQDVDAAFKDGLLAFLGRFRMLAHDLQIRGAVRVPLEIRLVVGLSPGYWRSDVLESLKLALGPSVNPVTGRLGLFHPDALRLGQPVYLSQLISAALQVKGVRWVDAVRFGRYGAANELVSGVITLRDREVARIDNAAAAPEGGTLEFVIGGGS